MGALSAACSAAGCAEVRRGSNESNNLWGKSANPNPLTGEFFLTLLVPMSALGDVQCVLLTNLPPGHGVIYISQTVSVME